MNALKKIVLLLWVVIAHTATASETSIILPAPPDSCICCPDSLIGYTDEQDARCLECLVNRLKKDSTIEDQRAVILSLRAEKGIINEQLSLCSDLTNAQRAQIKKILRKKKWLGIGFGTATGIAIFELLIIIIN